MPESFKVTAESGGFKDLAQEVRDTAKAMTEAAQADAALQRQVKQNRAQRFPAGPNQRLLQLDEFQRQAEAMPAGARRDAILADLPILRFRADRSRILGERRLGQGDDALNSPGLLDLFQELNGLMKARNPGQFIGAGMRLLQTGGLNIEQRLAGAGLGRAAAAAGAGEATGAAGLAGVAELAGPIGIAVAGFAAAGIALQTFTQELGTATADVREFTQARTLSGATNGEIARLSALGVPTGAIPSLAANLRARLENDGLAQATAAGLGVPLARASRFGGPQDDARFLEAALLGLRKVTDAEERLRRARILGVESMLELTYTSERVFQAQMREAQAREQIYDPKTVQGARDLAASMSLAQRQMDDLRTSFLAPAIPEAEKRIEVLNQALERMGPLAKVAGKGAGDLVNELLNSATAGIWGHLGKIASDATTAQQAAADNLGDSAEQLKYIAEMLKTQEFGGGPLARGTMPGGVNRNPNLQAETDWAEWHANRIAGPW